MATGTLEVAGTIDVAQFWPNGTSDADMAKVLVSVANGAFRFRPHPGAPFSTTHVFDRATVKGKTTKSVADAKDHVTIRLQGIDAPELHYMPQATKTKPEHTAQQRKLFLEWNFNYRQPLGATAAMALGTMLGAVGTDTLPCTITTAVEHPNAFDTYGRLIGDIIVQRQGHDFNVNRWLLEEGWAFPTYYNSMSREEITALEHIAAAAAPATKGAWKVYKKAIGNLDFTLQKPKLGDPVDPQDAKAPIIMPKLFRRQVTYEVNRKAKMISGSFEKFLMDNPDRCYRTDDFLAQGAASATPLCASLTTTPSTAGAASTAAERPATPDVLHLFSAEATQTGMLPLLYVMAGVGLAVSALVVGAVARDWYRNERAASTELGHVAKTRPSDRRRASAEGAFAELARRLLSLTSTLPLPSRRHTAPPTT